MFVGAGPGNPDLLTLEAFRTLQQAEVVLYDALVGPEVLAMIPENVEQIYVGKRATNHSMKQKEINETLLEMTEQYERVVRLKGGDTLIYARLSDELEALQGAGIAYRVLAGVTTCSGTAAALNLPLTSRDCGSELLITTVSTYEDPETCQAVSHFLRRGSGVAVYMPTFRGEHILSNLLHAKTPEDIPLVAVVEATLPTQRQLTTTIGQAEYSVLCAFSARAPTIFLLGKPFASALPAAMLKEIQERVHAY